MRAGFMSQRALIALDWGTSNLRASLPDAAGTAIDTRGAPGGVLAVQGGRFADAPMALCGDWITGHICPLIASGMVGSRQGWKEVPYLACPVGQAEAAQRLTAVPVHAASGRVLLIAPGLQCVDEQWPVRWGASRPKGRPTACRAS